MRDAGRFLRAYDEQLRTDAETPGAIDVTHLGPVRLVTFGGGRGFITYRDLAGADEQTIAEWVVQALAYYRQRPDVTRVEWKTRGHDHAPGLHDALTRNGFEPDEPESIMIGEAKFLDVEVPLPAGVRLRRVTDEADVRAMVAMQGQAFGDPVSSEMAEEILDRLARGDGMELWVAEAEGQIVSAGRLEPVAGRTLPGSGAARRWRVGGAGASTAP